MQNRDNSPRVLCEFVDASKTENWMAVNDNVMGGVSKGEGDFSSDGCLSFSGSLSLENNGGFASIRSQPTDFDLGGYDGLRIRVKGDGRTYQFRLRIDKNFDGVAYKQEFETIENEWIEVELPFTLFMPTFRGKILADVKPVDPADIRQLGFLIADKQAGPFNLVVDKIIAFK